MYRSRTAALFFVLLCAALLSFGFAYAQEQDDGDGNLECPDLPQHYFYLKGGPAQEGQRVNLYGKTCVDLENKKVAARGHCEGPKFCVADRCGDKPCELTKLQVHSMQKLSEESVPLSPPSPPPPGSDKDSWLNKAFEPIPFIEHSKPPSQSAQSFEDLIKQGGAIPSEGEKKPSWLDSVKEFFSPPAVSPDESFQLQPRDEHGAPIPQDVGPQNTMTNPNSTFEAPSDGPVQTSDGIPQADACGPEGSWISCMRAQISGENIEEARVKGLPSNWNFGNMKSCSGGVCSGYQSFETPGDGARADINNIAKWVERGDDTLNNLMNRLSPPGDGNNTKAMVDYLSKELGISPNTRLDLSNETQTVKLFNEKAFLEHSVRATDVMAPRDIIDAYQQVAISRGITPNVQTLGPGTGIGSDYAAAQSGGEPVPQISDAQIFAQIPDQTVRTSEIQESVENFQQQEQTRLILAAREAGRAEIPTTMWVGEQYPMGTPIDEPTFIHPAEIRAAEADLLTERLTQADIQTAAYEATRQDIQSQENAAREARLAQADADSAAESARGQREQAQWENWQSNKESILELARATDVPTEQIPQSTPIVGPEPTPLPETLPETPSGSVSREDLAPPSALIDWAAISYDVPAELRVGIADPTSEPMDAPLVGTLVAEKTRPVETYSAPEPVSPNKLAEVVAYAKDNPASADLRVGIDDPISEPITPPAAEEPREVSSESPAQKDQNTFAPKSETVDRLEQKMVSSLDELKSELTFWENVNTPEQIERWTAGCDAAKERGTTAFSNSCRFLQQYQTDVSKYQVVYDERAAELAKLQAYKAVGTPLTGSLAQSLQDMEKGEGGTSAVLKTPWRDGFERIGTGPLNTILAVPEIALGSIPLLVARAGEEFLPSAVGDAIGIRRDEEHSAYCGAVGQTFCFGEAALDAGGIAGGAGLVRSGISGLLRLPTAAGELWSGTKVAEIAPDIGTTARLERSVPDASTPAESNNVIPFVSTKAAPRESVAPVQDQIAVGENIRPGAEPPVPRGKPELSIVRNDSPVGSVPPSEQVPSNVSQLRGVESKSVLESGAPTPAETSKGFFADTRQKINDLYDRVFGATPESKPLNGEILPPAKVSGIPPKNEPITLDLTATEVRPTAPETPPAPKIANAPARSIEELTPVRQPEEVMAQAEKPRVRVQAESRVVEEPPASSQTVVADTLAGAEKPRVRVPAGREVVEEVVPPTTPRTSVPTIKDSTTGPWGRAVESDATAVRGPWSPQTSGVPLIAQRTSEPIFNPVREWTTTGKWVVGGVGAGVVGLPLTHFGLKDGSGGGGGTTPPPGSRTPPPVPGPGKKDDVVSVVPTRDTRTPCGPNDTYASSGCYPPYTYPLQNYPIPNPNGAILDRDYYCITSIQPVIVVPVPAGTRFPSNCYNNPSGGSSANPFSQLGQMLAQLINPPPMPPTVPPSPTPRPVIPPTSTSTPPKPIATLIADTATLALGGKSRLIWSSINTSSCGLFTPDNISMATGTRGSTSTLALATTTLFTLNCSASSGATTSAQATVTVQ